MYLFPGNWIIRAERNVKSYEQFSNGRYFIFIFKFLCHYCIYIRFMMIKDIRLRSQQLAYPRFKTPLELVSWTGALQAQDYPMAKWATGMRLKVPSSVARRKVEEALSGGELLRVHVMRPTWHLVPGEDIRWMVKLSARRIRRAGEAFGKDLEISEKLYLKCNRLMENMLSGHKSLTKQEMGAALENAGIAMSPARLSLFLMRAETDGILCSGPDKEGRFTYALLEERAPFAKDLPAEEALAVLAARYFRSRSPAGLQDFVWWSGLSVTEARQALESIRGKLVKERLPQGEVFIHDACCREPVAEETVHFLPPFDEYLLGYKDRSAVLDAAHRPKAFNNWGIFYPVILHNGRIAGNWSRTAKKSGREDGPVFFEEGYRISSGAVQRAAERYREFSAG